MPSLAEVQRQFSAVLNSGPAHLPPDLFAGDRERIILGLKAHANTISHARLVALEEAFPLTRTAIGEQPFNDLCRRYAETAAARSAELADIGTGFPAFANAAGASPQLVDLAAIEQAWLESYHAADAEAASLTHIASLPPDGIAEVRVCLHPAVRLCMLHAPLASVLAESLAHAADATTMMIVRPEQEVRLVPINTVAAQMANICTAPITIGNLLAAVSEHHDTADPAEPLLTLIGAGAIILLE